VAIPVYRNVVQKEAEGKLKYKSLCIEIQRMRNLKCMIIPVIIGATGMVTKFLRKNSEAMPGKTFNRGTTKGSCSKNETQNTESAIV